MKGNEEHTRREKFGFFASHTPCTLPLIITRANCVVLLRSRWRRLMNGSKRMTLIIITYIVLSACSQNYVSETMLKLKDVLLVDGVRTKITTLPSMSWARRKTSTFIRLSASHRSTGFINKIFYDVAIHRVTKRPCI